MAGLKNIKKEDIKKIKDTAILYKEHANNLKQNDNINEFILNDILRRLTIVERENKILKNKLKNIKG